MTYKQIASMIESIGLPFTYYSFPNNMAPAPPYIVFNYPERDDFGADNINYAPIEVLNLELYTASKNFALEQTIETILTQNGFFYEKNESYIRDEELYIITYDMEFIKEN